MNTTALIQAFAIIIGCSCFFSWLDIKWGYMSNEKHRI